VGGQVDALVTTELTWNRLTSRASATPAVRPSSEMAETKRHDEPNGTTAGGPSRVSSAMLLDELQHP